MIRQNMPSIDLNPPSVNYLHYTLHTGKLAGMMSLSTSCFQNEWCRSMPTDICKHCFSIRTESMYKNLEARLINNYKLLQTPLSDVQLILPLDIYGKVAMGGFIMRLHAFGELGSKQHAKNFAQMAHVNPTITFTLWTKRPEFFKGLYIPNNLNIMYSAGMLNATAETASILLKDKQKKFPFVKAIYYVGDKDHIKESCGEHCITCRRCYDLKKDTLIAQKLHQ